MTNSKLTVRALRALLATVVIALFCVASPTTVSAHTDFAGSNPADGTTVDGPLSVVVVEFTNPASESGNGFELLAPDGTVRTPDSVDPTDGTSFLVAFDPALDAGTYGFRWDVRAGDAHPIQGSFTFDVAVAAPETTVPATTVADAAVDAATTDTTTPDAVGADADAAEPVSTTAPAAVVETAAQPPETGALDASTVSSDDGATISMDEFLTEDGSPDPFSARAARTVTTGSTIFAVGTVASLMWVVRGRRDEIDRLLVWARIAGLGILTGGVMSVAELEDVLTGSFVDFVTSAPGFSALLAVAGGVLTVVGFGSLDRGVVGSARTLSSAAVVGDRARAGGVTASTTDTSDRFGWTPTAAAAPGLVGVALALGSYWFDGHTVSRGPWVLHALVNLVHVGAASVWVGGVLTLTLLAWMRKRNGSPTGVGAMIVRFSSIAAISLAALTVAGVVMAWLVVDSPGDLFGTEWGRLLLIKIGAVAVAAALGGYNHFALRPALEADPDDADLVRRLRVSLSVESIVMLSVIVITAILVAASV